LAPVAPVLPDGRHFVYVATSATGPSLFAGALDSSSRTLVLKGAIRSAYASGRLLFVRDDTLLAQPFDPVSLRLSREPSMVVEYLGINGPSARTAFSVSDAGVLAFRNIPPEVHQLSQLVWRDRSGKLLQSVGAPGDYEGLSLSADDTQLALFR